MRTGNPGPGILCSQNGGFRTANPGTGILRSQCLPTEGRTQMRGPAPATCAQAPRRALADSRSSRGLRCARFTPALALAPERRGCASAPLSCGGLRCAAQSGRGGGLVWGFFEFEKGRPDRGSGLAVAAADVGMHCEPGEAERRSTRPDCELENGVQKFRVAQHLRERSECTRKIPGPGFSVRSVSLQKGELQCEGPRRLRSRKPRAERSQTRARHAVCAAHA